MLVWIALFIFFLILIFIVFNYVAFFNAAPFVPTTNTKLATMLELAMLEPHKKAVELGSGDGRIVIALAKAGIETDGYEINPILVLFSKIRIKAGRLDAKAHVHWKSFWNVDFSSYDLVTVYCLPNQMSTLSQKLRSKLPKNASVVSNTFTFKTLTLVKEKNNVRLYKV